MAFPDREVLFGLMEETWSASGASALASSSDAVRAAVVRRGDAALRDRPARPRFELEIQEATDDTRGSEFGVFANAACVRYIAVPKKLSRTEVQDVENHARSWGAKGLAYIVFRADGRRELADREVPQANLLDERWR